MSSPRPVLLIAAVVLGVMMVPGILRCATGPRPISPRAQKLAYFVEMGERLEVEAGFRCVDPFLFAEPGPQPTAAKWFERNSLIADVEATCESPIQEAPCYAVWCDIAGTNPADQVVSSRWKFHLMGDTITGMEAAPAVGTTPGTTDSR